MLNDKSLPIAQRAVRLIARSATGLFVLMVLSAPAAAFAAEDTLQPASVEVERATHSARSTSSDNNSASGKSCQGNCDEATSEDKTDDEDDPNDPVGC